MEYTHEELCSAFGRVGGKTWKDPVDAVLFNVSDAELGKIEESIVQFTGLVPVVTRGRKGKVRVQTWVFA